MIPKICINCDKEKDENSFEITSKSKFKIHRKNVCKDCRYSQNKIHRKLLKIFQASIYNNCQICGNRSTLSLDHDHVNGKFRGWLCRSCNLGLGCLGDNLDAVERAIDYLTKN